MAFLPCPCACRVGMHVARVHVCFFLARDSRTPTYSEEREGLILAISSRLSSGRLFGHDMRRLACCLHLA